jgi:hypothetical protein
MKRKALFSDFKRKHNQKYVLLKIWISKVQIIHIQTLILTIILTQITIKILIFIQTIILTQIIILTQTLMYSIII